MTIGWLNSIALAFYDVPRRRERPQEIGSHPLRKSCPCLGFEVTFKTSRPLWNIYIHCSRKILDIYPDGEMTLFSLNWLVVNFHRATECSCTCTSVVGAEGLDQARRCSVASHTPNGLIYNLTQVSGDFPLQQKLLISPLCNTFMAVIAPFLQNLIVIADVWGFYSPHSFSQKNTLYCFL